MKIAFHPNNQLSWEDYIFENEDVEIADSNGMADVGYFDKADTIDYVKDQSFPDTDRRFKLPFYRSLPEILSGKKMDSNKASGSVYGTYLNKSYLYDYYTADCVNNDISNNEKTYYTTDIYSTDNSYLLFFKKSDYIISQPGSLRPESKYRTRIKMPNSNSDFNTVKSFQLIIDLNYLNYEKLFDTLLFDTDNLLKNVFTGNWLNAYINYITKKSPTTVTFSDTEETNVIIPIKVSGLLHFYIFDSINPNPGIYNDLKIINGYLEIRRTKVTMEGLALSSGPQSFDKIYTHLVLNTENFIPNLNLNVSSGDVHDYIYVGNLSIDLPKSYFYLEESLAYKFGSSVKNPIVLSPSYLTHTDYSWLYSYIYPNLTPYISCFMEYYGVDEVSAKEGSKYVDMIEYIPAKISYYVNLEKFKIYANRYSIIDKESKKNEYFSSFFKGKKNKNISLNFGKIFDSIDDVENLKNIYLNFSYEYSTKSIADNYLQNSEKLFSISDREYYNGDYIYCFSPHYFGRLGTPYTSQDSNNLDAARNTYGRFYSLYLKTGMKSLPTGSFLTGTDIVGFIDNPNFYIVYTSQTDYSYNILSKNILGLIPNEFINCTISHSSTHANDYFNPFGLVGTLFDLLNYSAAYDENKDDLLLEDGSFEKPVLLHNYAYLQTLEELTDTYVSSTVVHTNLIPEYARKRAQGYIDGVYSRQYFCRIPGGYYRIGDKIYKDMLLTSDDFVPLDYRRIEDFCKFGTTYDNIDDDKLAFFGIFPCDAKGNPVATVSYTPQDNVVNMDDDYDVYVRFQLVGPDYSEIIVDDATFTEWFGDDFSMRFQNTFLEAPTLGRNIKKNFSDLVPNKEALNTWIKVNEGKIGYKKDAPIRLRLFNNEEEEDWKIYLPLHADNLEDPIYLLSVTCNYKDNDMYFDVLLGPEGAK